jgi:membrane-bound lytic murein transglycosylase D
MRYLLIFFIAFSCLAHDFVKIADDDYFLLSDKLSNDVVEEGEDLLLERKKIMNIVLKDEKKLISDTFQIPEYFQTKVKFWLKIYTVYSTGQVVIHDKNNLDIIYKELDFHNLWDSNLNIFTKSNIQSKLVREKSNEIKSKLIKMKKDSYISVKKTDLYKILKRNGLELSVNSKTRKKQLDKLIKNIRAQTGQRNKQKAGILNFLPFELFFEKTFKLFDLPHELLGIPFLESSFNHRAHSKVGAKGIWQIMPFIAKKMLPYNKSVDARKNPFLATLAALHLLKQNYRILKRWDLAVTAYNSGTKHIINASRRLKILKQKLALETIFQRYKHPHLGFASKNFYSEFLALLRVLEYRKLIFSLGNNNSKEDEISIYLTRCKTRPNYLFKKYKGKILADYNNHFNYPKRLYGKGQLIVAKGKLPKGKFLKVKESWMKKSYPRNLWKFARRYSCSTK